MLKSLANKIFGSYSDREVRRIQPIVTSINALESDYRELSDEELKYNTQWFKDRLAAGETLDDILPEAFATVREAASRVLNMRHFEVQLIGGIILHQGRIAEMKTGEGKTLVATLPVYLNALTGKGVYVVTVNDYLARRDSEWMGKLYRFLGLSVGLVTKDVPLNERKAAYDADITYGTNNEFGFDYLRDNMSFYKESQAQRGHNFAIIDEVDSILIDEARTPLIISGMSDESSDLYEQAEAFVNRLKVLRIKEADRKTDMDAETDADYIVDEKARTATLTLHGIRKAEECFGVDNWSDMGNMTLSHHVNQAIKAHGTMVKDRDYVVQDGEVIIVDSFTGRLMPGRRYSDGLHQAIEAKEHVKVENESRTMATITLQNFFRMFSKLSGMTGTAQTEEREFREIYRLDVVTIPTNRPMARQDLPDCLCPNLKEKYITVLKDVQERHAKGQPILVGTTSVESSEIFSTLLKKAGVPHNVLNAKNHAKEAEIIAQAGRKGAVTIATNMAGRGTDIILGGNADFMARKDLKKEGYEDVTIEAATGYADVDDETILAARELYRSRLAEYKKIVAVEAEEVLKAGGLCVIGTERNENRRIDNQLCGRAGRQGDLGVTRFYISFEDDLFRLFGGPQFQRLRAFITKDGKLDQNIDIGLISTAVENSQRRIEERNFNIRKNVLQYDDVINEQRKIIYAQRQQVLDGLDMHESVLGMLKSVVADGVMRYAAVSPYAEEWDWEGMRHYFDQLFMASNELNFSKSELEDMTSEALIAQLTEQAMTRLSEIEEKVTPEVFREVERQILLRLVDEKWVEYLDNVDHLKQGIGLRAFAQHDPVVEFRMETERMYDETVDNIKEAMVLHMFRVSLGEPVMNRRQVRVNAVHGDVEATREQPRKVENKVGRNDPCPCGSGKKYKKCCGK